jgi:hypothetical protein
MKIYEAEEHRKGYRDLVVIVKHKGCPEEVVRRHSPLFLKADLSRKTKETKGAMT